MLDHMDSWRQAFLKFALDRGVLEFGTFKLKSGRTSPYFFNAGLFNTGQDLARLGHYYARAITESGIDCDLLFGPAYKGIPLAAITAVSLAEQYNHNLAYSFNRKQAKDHGEGGMIVGAPLKGRVLIIDDVITAGTAITESMRIIEANGATAVGVVIALDRCEKGLGDQSAVQEVETRYGLRVISIATVHELVDLVASSTELKPRLTEMREYQKRYGSTLNPAST
ncbi:MAG: orotate phosphoribosyltransferase [Gammaproteobacteria bacterium]|nr:MAG: orotate phosphoribosyltransferase [Gammaproteobacteria bacterium]